MVYNFTHRKPKRRVVLQHTHDDAFSLLPQPAGHCVDSPLFVSIGHDPQLFHPGDGLAPASGVAAHLKQPIQLVNVGCTLEDLLASVQLQDEGSEGKHINFGVIMQIQYYFQGTIPASHHVVRVLAVGADGHGKTEIYQLHAQGSGVDQHILRLDVAVHEAFLMHVVQGLGNLVENVADLLIVEVAAMLGLKFLVVGDQITWQVLQHQVGVQLVTKSSQQFDDVGMTEGLQGPDFTIQHHMDVGVGVVYLLDSDEVVSEGIECFVDGAVGSVADLMHDIVPLHAPELQFQILLLGVNKLVLTDRLHISVIITLSDFQSKPQCALFNNNRLLSQNIISRMLSKFINKGYQAQACQLCKTEFNLLYPHSNTRKLQRIHKCKRCNKHVCWRCGNQKQRVLDEDCKWTPDVHRVCNCCNKELNEINHLIDNRNMAWGRDSDFAKDWLARMDKCMPSRRAKERKDFEYQHFLKLFLSNKKNFEEEYEIIDKDVIRGRTDFTVFNFSLKQFIYMVQQKSNCDVEQSRVNIANVLYAIAARFDQVGYVQGMSAIAAFLLCYSSEETAYILFCDLIENIFPEKFLVRGNFGENLIGMLAETHFLKQYFVHVVTEVKGPLISHEREPYDQQQIQHFRMIVELSTAKALLSLFVTFLSYRHLSFVWSQLSEHRSFEVAERAFLATLYLNRQSLIEKRSFKQLENLFEKLDYEQFVETYYDLDIDTEFKNRLLEEFYQTLHKKWSNNSEQNIKQLHRVTNFSEEEIKVLQSKFSTSQEVINKEDFVLLVKCYYDILKENSESEAPFLEITSYFVQKLFDSYVTNKRQTKQPSIVKDDKARQSRVVSSQQTPQEVYLDFRQFVCCFSLCTKSLLKQRLCAILNTFRDKNKRISFASFQNLIRDLCSISPAEMDDKKKEFLLRMNRYFYNQEDGISINQLYILLNDNFINELAVYIRCDAPAIVAKSIAKFQAIKFEHRTQPASAVKQ